MKKISINEKALYSLIQKVVKHYGFSTPHEWLQTHAPHVRIKSQKKEPIARQDIQEIISCLQYYIAHITPDVEPKLALFWHTTFDALSRKEIVKNKKTLPCATTLTSIGMTDAYAEAIIIPTAIKILKENGITDIVVRINSVGETETSTKYLQNFTRGVRKYQDELKKEGIALWEHSPHLAHKILHTSNHKEFDAFVSNTFRFLNESDRTLFQLCIEYLDAQHISYELAPNIIEDPQYAAHTVFEITSPDGLTVYAHGARYDNVSKKIFKKEIGVVSATIHLPGMSFGTYAPSKQKKECPDYFLVHSGKQARLDVINMLNNLYDSGVQVAHAIQYKKVNQQIAEQRSMHTPYTAIIGEEEIKDDTVRIRKNLTRSVKIMNKKQFLGTIKKTGKSSLKKPTKRKK
ncbi:MAG: His/Gly/Thr/Pro-type tRNA ligase C-terminal domain-containing protein [Alphaproteobacteria bacterium]|nr:His/Gly/Thr/Pro-type tRNA ligase C-terminal domain-containing protein [Alphaproteobacteria bacterium]